MNNDTTNNNQEDTSVRDEVLGEVSDTLASIDLSTEVLDILPMVEDEHVEEKKAEGTSN